MVSMPTPSHLPPRSSLRDACGFPGRHAPKARVDLKNKSHRCFEEKKSYPHVLSASPPRGMVQTRCTPVFVSSLLPQVSRSNALIAVTIKCLTAMIDHVELRYSTKSYSPSPTLSLLLTTLSPTPMIPLTTTTTTQSEVHAVNIHNISTTS